MKSDSRVRFESANSLFSDPEPLKRCEISELEKYYDDRWINDYLQSRRRSSNEDEGVEEDFSSSGSGVESNTSITVRKTSSNDFEELTQMMKKSLTVSLENSISTDNSNYSTTTVSSKTAC